MGDTEGTEEGTALETGAAPAEGTALESGGTPPVEGAPVEIPEKFKNEDGTAKVGDLIKSYTGLETLMHSVGKPPKDVDGYKIEYKFPEGTEINADAQKEFLGKCLEQGMSNKAVQFIMDEYAGMVTTAGQAEEHTKAETVELLKGEWGDKYHDNMGSALKAFNALVGDVSHEEKLRLQNDPAVIRLLSNAGANLSEDILPKSGAASQGMSAEDLNTLMNSKAYLNEKDPGHAIAVEKVTKFYKSKYPKKV